MPINITMPALLPTMEEGNLAMCLVIGGGNSATDQFTRKVKINKVIKYVN
ncbi:MAG: hypothetical protein O2910_06510 [Proteobacteria bacterium]|nr:hypothetical protein [Pseudomonadota bacterium]